MEGERIPGRSRTQFLLTGMDSLSLHVRGLNQGLVDHLLIALRTGSNLEQLQLP